MSDPLESLLHRFELQARIFHTGALCERVWFDSAEQVGHIHLLRSGVLELEMQGGAKQRFDRPAMLFFPAPTGHRLIPKHKEGCDLVCATIDFGARLHNPVMTSFPGMVVVPLEQLAPLEWSLALLFDEANAARAGRQAMLDRLAEVVVIQVLRHLIAQGLVQGGVLAGLADARLALALQAVHADPASAWTMETMAERAGMSRARFAVHFKAVLGQTPADYLLRWRMAVAKTMLKQNKPIKWIANQVGYANPPALTRAFGAVYGMTPTAWLAQQEPGID